MTQPARAPLRLAVVESAPKGGLLHYAAQLAEGLASLGHDVDLITARGHELDPPVGVNVRDVLAPAVRTPTESPEGVRRLLRRAGIATRVVSAALRTMVELARGSYDAAILADDLSVAPAAAGALAMTWLPGDLKIAAIAHEPRPRSRRGGDLYQSSPVLLALLRRFYPRARVVFVHGEGSRAELLDAWPGSRVEVIPHGDERILVGAEPPGPAEEPRALFFGEWRRAKGLWDLIAAFDRLVERFPEARLTLAGLPTPDVEPERVRAWAAERGERVTLVDRYVEIAEVGDLFGGARAVVAPYIAGSQSGVVHLAMTMQRAVVASDAGELPAAVADGETGRIVPSGDVEALCDALAEVLGDRKLAERWGAAGRRRVLSEFGWERVAERVASALER